MNVVIKKTSVRLLLSWTQRVLVTGGVLMLGYCGYVLVDTWNFERRATQLLAEDQQVRQAGAQATPFTAGTSLAAVTSGGLIGRIEIPRIGLSVVLIEGTSNKILRRAVGHIAGTALPGQLGNVGVAGHRDRFFRPLRKIQKNDFITLTTPGKIYRYRVVSAKVVSPNDVAVLASDGGEILTLVTCYPFYFVGEAPDRFIVRAERVKG